MIRTLTEFLVSRSIDDDKPLPEWIQRRVERESSLQRFQRQIQHAHVALQNSADEQCQILTADSSENVTIVECARIESPRRNSSVASRPGRPRLAKAALAIAAGLLVIALVNRSLEREANAARVEMLSQQLADLPPAMLQWLNLSVESSQAGIGRYAPTTQLSFPTPPPWDAWDWRDHVQFDSTDGSSPASDEPAPASDVD